MPRPRPNCCNITKSDCVRLSRGHALGATGLAQLYELVLQLRGRAEGRQVADARMAMAVNGGGWLDGAYALAIATILENRA